MKTQRMSQSTLRGQAGRSRSEGRTEVHDEQWMRHEQWTRENEVVVRASVGRGGASGGNRQRRASAPRPTGG